MRKISNEEFNTKYYMYKDMIYNIAYTYVHNVTDADDIVQDVFMKYLNSTEYFETLDNEKYWLVRVTINTAKTLVKRAWRQKVELDDEKISKFSSYEEQQNYELFEIVSNLSPKYKDVIVLYYYENMSTNDIARTLNLSVSNVKKRLERARKAIKEKEIRNG